MKTWDINKTLYKVSDFLSWQKNGNLLLNPSFQRRSVWKKGAKSYFIDTIVCGLPVPIIFLRERRTDINNLEPVREVVDGQQRLRTLIGFIAPKYLKDFNLNKDDFKLSKTHNKNLGNLKFDQFPPEIKQRILDYQFSVHILPANTDDRDVLQIFGRMNSTGIKLNDQELRNAEYFGEFKTSVYETALKFLAYWRKWQVFSDDNIARMSEVELCSELYSLIMKGITAKSHDNLSKIYEEYDDNFKSRKIVEDRIEEVLEEINSKLGTFLPESEFKKSTLFYTLFAVVYNNGYGLNSNLKKTNFKKLTEKQVQVIKNVSELIKNETANEKLLDATSTRRATNLENRTFFYNYFKNRLK